jgi:hypothetical protein
MAKQVKPMPRRRRSKRKVNFGATRFSKRKQALIQQDHAIYGNDYGILPSGTFCGYVKEKIVCVRSVYFYVVSYPFFTD